MTKQDNGRRAKLMFELVAAEDARNAALNPTTTAVPFGNEIVVRGERVYAADMRFCRAAMMLAIDLRTNPDEPDSALVAEVARLRGYLEKIRKIAIPTALIYLWASEALES